MSIGGCYTFVKLWHTIWFVGKILFSILIEKDVFNIFIDERGVICNGSVFFKLCVCLCSSLFCSAIPKHSFSCLLEEKASLCYVVCFCHCWHCLDFLYAPCFELGLHVLMLACSLAFVCLRFFNPLVIAFLIGVFGGLQHGWKSPKSRLLKI